MKKLILISFGLITALLIILLSLVIYFSFFKVKPTADALNQKLTQKFSKLVRIPTGLPRPQKSYAKTSYYWEMETLQKEVVGVKFEFDPAYTKGQETITLILDMPQGGDPSVFHKVLPAVISDSQSFTAASDPQKADFGGNKEAGYTNIKINRDQNNVKTIRIIWEFSKVDFDEDIKNLYAQLDKYPHLLLKIFITIPIIARELIAG